MSAVARTRDLLVVSKDLPPPPKKAAKDFTRTPDGKIYKTQDNLYLAMDKLGVRVRFDEFTRAEQIFGLDGFGPHLDDRALRRLRLQIDAEFKFRVDKDWFIEVVLDRADKNRFHPVREYLDAQTWDGKPRLDRWLIDLAGAEDTLYVRAVSRLILIAAVRRVRHPGSKFDEMPILEAGQGVHKSTAVKILAVYDDWFGDDLPLGSNTQRLMEATAGKWIIEAGELKGMSKSDVAELKGWLSRTKDEGRLAYGRMTTRTARAFVVIGTTNETEGYLKDPTGNRRFWPVRVKEFDLDQLRATRDQLWAEAAFAELQNESIRLDPALYAAAAVEQRDRAVDDPMLPVLREALGDITGKLKTTDAFRILNIEPGKATQEQNARIGSVMRSLGWERDRRRFDGALEYAYLRGEEHEQLAEIEVRVTGTGVAATVTITRKRP